MLELLGSGMASEQLWPSAAEQQLFQDGLASKPLRQLQALGGGNVRCLAAGAQGRARGPETAAGPGDLHHGGQEDSRGLQQLLEAWPHGT